MPICRLCKRECAEGSELCKYHLRARRNLESEYERWKYAYGPMTWKEYLRRVGKNRETGQWAREVAALLAEEQAR